MPSENLKHSNGADDIVENKPELSFALVGRYM